MDKTYLVDDKLNNINLDIHEQEFFNISKPSLKSISEDNNITLSSEETLYTLDLRISEFESDKELKRFINKCKQLIRQSYEYRLWVDYVKEYHDANICLLTNESNAHLTIEIHHHPISLENMVTAIINTKMENGEKFCSFDIAIEAIELHYKLKVGFIPLISSLHEKFHNGHLNLPIDMVIGDYEYLLRNYHFTEDQLETINRYRQITSKDCIFYRRVMGQEEKIA